MAYIYEKVKGNNTYYYLRLDKKVKGKKIVKDIAYLGNNLQKININTILNNTEYKKEINKSYKTINKYLSSKYYLEKAKAKKFKKNKHLTKEQQINLEAIKLHFNNRFLKLHKQTQLDIYNNFLISFTYNSTAIEGNTILLRDVKKILSDEKINLKDKTLREVYDLRNTKDTFFDVFNKKISVKLIINTHKGLMKDIDNRIDFRNFDVRVIKARFKSAPYFRIEKEINELIKWHNDFKDNSFVKSILFHHKFEQIHPFADGNGRTGRILLNNILLNNKFPPIIITRKNRTKYLDNLEIADKKEDYKPLIAFMIQEYEQSYWENFII